MGSPLLLATIFVVLVFLPVNPHSAAGRGLPLLALLVAGLFGCKLAYHMHMRAADNYGGAYTDPAAHRRARIHYLTACVAYSVVAVYLAHLALEARGFELPL